MRYPLFHYFGQKPSVTGVFDPFRNKSEAIPSAHQDDDEDGEYDDDEVENIKPGDKSASAVHNVYIVQ